jgi:hypothetical protein
MKRLLLIQSLLIPLVGCSTDGFNSVQSSGIAATETVSLGMAITPRNFPAHEMTDVDEAFMLASEIAEFIQTYKCIHHRLGLAA